MATTICEVRRPFSIVKGRGTKIKMVLVKHPPDGTTFLYDKDDVLVQNPDGTPRFMKQQQEGE